MASSIPSDRSLSLDITQLTRYFIAVNDNPQTVLNPNTLEPEKGALSRARHNTILSLVLNLLPSILLPTTTQQQVTCLKFGICGYIGKSKAAFAAVKKDNTIDDHLACQIFGILDSFKPSAIEQGSDKSVVSKTPTPVSKDECPDEASIQHNLSYHATQWYVYKALEYTSLVLARSLHLRDKLVNSGYRFTVTKKGFVALPPLSLFTSPWPIQLLGFCSQKAIRKGTQETALLRKSIFRIKKAKEVFSTYKDELEAFLTSVELNELLLQAAQMTKDCCYTIIIIQAQFSEDALGKLMQNLFSEVKVINNKSDELQKYEQIHFSTSYPSEESEFMVGEDLERREIELFRQLCDLFAQSAATYRLCIHQLAAEDKKNSYSAFFERAQRLILNHSKRHKVGKEPPLPKFKPFFAAPIFEQESLFFKHVSSKLPSPDEFFQFSPIEFTSTISKICREYETRGENPSPLTQHERLEFLPCERKTKPIPKKKKARKIQSPPQMMTQGAAQTDLVSERMAELSLESKENPPPQPSIPPSITSAPSSTIALAEPQMPLEEHAAIPSTLFGFHIGEKAKAKLKFSRRVTRWSDPLCNPFNDKDYRDRTFSPSVQESIRFQHTPPLPVINVLLSRGERYLHKDKVKESFYLPAEATWNDGSGKYEKGVITLGRNRYTLEIFHYHFSQQAPSTLQAQYASSEFYKCTEEEDLQELVCESSDSGKELPDDGSFISQIADTGVGFIRITVYDPNRKISFDVYFE